MKKADIEQKAQVACQNLKLSTWKHHEASQQMGDGNQNDFQVPVANDTTPGTGAVKAD